MVSEVESKLYRFHLFIPLFALIFWVWAIVNTITKFVDLGILSFALVILSSIYTLFQLRIGLNEESQQRLLLYFPTATHLTLSLNYLLGAFLMKHHWGKVYCGIFTFLWIVVAIVHFYLMQKFQKEPYISPNESNIDVEDMSDISQASKQELT